MKTTTYRPYESDRPSRRKSPLFAALIGAFCLVPCLSWAQQVETTAMCDEGGIPPIPEPVDMIYGDSTVDCGIGANGTDTDLFEFSGLTGENVRISLLTTTRNLDPFVEVRDDMGIVIGTDGCVANSANFCSFRLDIVLTKNGMHTIRVSEQGTDNTGGYTMQLDRSWPDRDIEHLSFDSRIIVDRRIIEFVDESSAGDTVSPQPDVDHYYFSGVAGTSIRLNVSTQTRNLDPAIEVRDPMGTLILNGPIDGANCVANSANFCSFFDELDLTVTGRYTVALWDWGADNSGSFLISLWCTNGIADCDNDEDAIPDIRPENLRYGESVATNSVSPAVDGDFYTFMGTPGDTIEITVLGRTRNLDPKIEVRDPLGFPVATPVGQCAANSANFCSFTQPLAPTEMGAYTMVVRDWGLDNTGSYTLTLNCVSSPDFPCDNIPGRFPIDVPEDYWAFKFIEILIDAGITSGCAEDMYCPGDPVTRGQMSVFMLRGINDGNYQPPACEGSVFGDVPQDSIFKCWIEQFFAEGITSGCSQDPAMYCPEDSVNRAQMAVFLLRAKHGSDYMPPPATGNDFDDVSIDYWAAAWIEQLAAEGITSGCSEEPSLYCPEEAVTRDQMAVFVVRTFGLSE